MSTQRFSSLTIPDKANRVLHLVFIGMVLLFVRLWYLSVIVHESKKEEAQRPREKTLVLPPNRGSIRDRFNIPFAINTTQYRATLVYAELRSIPGVIWEKNPKGKKEKRYVRKEYINQLARMLGHELSLDPTRVEDTIYSKAALYYQMPYTIKENLTERQYYRLKARENDWPGLHLERYPKRTYPLGPVAGEVIGYMGAIDKKEYETLLKEIKELRTELQASEQDVPLNDFSDPEELRQRLEELEDFAYSITDSVGKTGVEAQYEYDLRGYRGTKKVIVDARGRILASLPDSRPQTAGKRLLLTLSSELQEYCETLLIQNEKIRHVLSSNIEGPKKTREAKKEPWIKGGAIIAMDPKTGEILALASYPRYNPNDFVVSGESVEKKKKRERIARWFETEEYVGAIWDRRLPLEREAFSVEEKGITEEKIWLNWDTYLHFILPDEHPILRLFSQYGTLGPLLEFQEKLFRLIEESEQSHLPYLLDFLYQEEPLHIPHDTTFSAAERFHLERISEEKKTLFSSLKEELAPYFSDLPLHYDKVLFADLCHLLVPCERFSPSLKKAVRHHTLSSFREFASAVIVLFSLVKEETRALFHKQFFTRWREENQKRFLQQERKREKEERRAPRPFLDLLDEEEDRQWQAFWETWQWDLFLAYLQRRPEGKDLDPLLFPFFQILGERAAQTIPSSEWETSYTLAQDLLSPLDNTLAQAYLATARPYKELEKPLWGRYPSLRKEKGRQLERHLAAAFYPRYGFGYARSHAFRQATTQGSLFKLVTAYEALIQKYRKLQQEFPSLDDLNPLTMVDQVYRRNNRLYLGVTEEGKPLPQFYKGGRLPRSQVHQIGTLDIVKAIERSSNPYFSLLASEHLSSPRDLIAAAQNFGYGQRTGIDLPYELPGKLPADIDVNKTELYAFAIGQSAFVATPLQTAVMVSALANGGSVLQPKILRLKVGIDKHDSTLMPESTPTIIRKDLFLPTAVQQTLFRGMQQMADRTRTTLLYSLQKMYHDYPEWIALLNDPSLRWIGKTSTAEAIETLDLDAVQGRQIYSHIWFGGILNPPEPDLVVIVYLRYGGYGKEAAPIALAVANKWREIQVGKK